MKRLDAIAFAVIFVSIGMVVGIAFSIWHDLRPAPQPVAPTGDLSDVRREGTNLLRWMLNIQSGLAVQAELNAKYDAMGDLVCEMDKMLTRHEEEIHEVIGLIAGSQQREADRLGVKLPYPQTNSPPDETNFLWLTNIYAHEPSFSAELLVAETPTPLLSLRANGEPVVDVATNGEVTLYVSVSEASKEFWCLLSKWAQEERAFLAQHPLDSILWTNHSPAWNLDLPPSGSTNTFDPFNLDHETRTKHEHNRNL